METLGVTSERIPTVEKLTEFVNCFVEEVKQLMDLMNIQTETADDVACRVRNKVGMKADYDYRKSVFNFYRKAVLEDGTEIRLAFNPSDEFGRVEIKIEITKIPPGRSIKMNELKHAGFHTVRVSNYSIKKDSPQSTSQQTVHGFQLLVEDRNGREFDIDSSSDIPEKNSIGVKILYELHKFIVDEMYKPYTKPARTWFQKLFS